MKVAIITPGFLPVPAESGGAIEKLIQYLIEENENSKSSILDIYTIPTKKTYDFKNSKIIYCKPNIIDKIKSIIYNRFNMLISIFNKNNKGNYISPYSVNIKKQIKLFEKREGYYDYIVVENNLTVVNILHKRKNLIFHLHNDILGEDKPHFQCMRAINCCKTIISVSKFIKNRLLSLDKDASVSILYNCVDLDIFDKKRYIIKKSSDSFNFFFSGRIVPEKGILELLKAFELLLHKHKNISLTIVGSSIFDKQELSDYEKELREISLNFKDKIIFTGYQKSEDVAALLANMDCVIIPTINEEPFGIVSLEAMAMKKLIIASDGGALPEIVEGHGLIVPRDNIIENLYQTMDLVYNNFKQYDSIRQKGYSYVINNSVFHKKDYYTNFLAIIERLSNEKNTTSKSRKNK